MKTVLPAGLTTAILESISENLFTVDRAWLVTSFNRAAGALVRSRLRGSLHHEEQRMENKLPLIGERVPSFKAETTQGPLNFPEDVKGKWVVFFSHPADFTPVCTTEFMTFAAMQPECEKRNCTLIGLSIDSTYSHIA